MGKKHVDSTDIRRKMKTAATHYQHEDAAKPEEAWSAKSAVSAESRQKMIAEAAYYIAERRGFAGNEAYDDWVKAEADIDAMLLSRVGKSHS